MNKHWRKNKGFNPFLPRGSDPGPFNLNPDPDPFNLNPDPQLWERGTNPVLQTFFYRKLLFIEEEETAKLLCIGTFGAKVFCNDLNKFSIFFTFVLKKNWILLLFLQFYNRVASCVSLGVLFIQLILKCILLAKSFFDKFVAIFGNIFHIAQGGGVGGQVWWNFIWAHSDYVSFWSI